MRNGPCRNYITPEGLGHNSDDRIYVKKSRNIFKFHFFFAPFLFSNFEFLIFLFVFFQVGASKLTVSAVVLQMMLVMVLLLLMMMLVMVLMVLVRAGQLPAIVTRDDGALIGRRRSDRPTAATGRSAVTSRLNLERF